MTWAALFRSPLTPVCGPTATGRCPGGFVHPIDFKYIQICLEQRSALRHSQQTFDRYDNDIRGSVWSFVDGSFGRVRILHLEISFHFMCRCFNGLTPHHLWSLWGEERVREWVWPVLDVLIIHHWQVPRKWVFFNIFLMAHSKVMSIRWLRLKTPWHFNQEQTWKNFVLLFF